MYTYVQRLIYTYKALTLYRIVCNIIKFRGKYPPYISSLEDWLDKLWYINIMENYISVKNNAATL